MAMQVSESDQIKQVGIFISKPQECRDEKVPAAFPASRLKRSRSRFSVHFRQDVVTEAERSNDLFSAEG